MFKRVDETDEQNIEGFSYINRFGEEELVEMVYDSRDPLVKIKDSTTKDVEIYLSDIDNLIKALTAAKNHLENM